MSAPCSGRATKARCSDSATKARCSDRATKARCSDRATKARCSGRAWRAALLALAAWAAATLSVAARPAPLRWTLDVTAGLGHANNAFQSETDRRPGQLVPLELGASLSRRHAGFRWQVELDADGRRFADPALRAADELSADLAARWQWDLRRQRQHPLRLRVKTTASAERSELTSRFSAGEDLVVADGTSLAHRYDSDQLRLDVDADITAGPHVEWGFGAMTRWRDYLHDYRNEPGVDSLDQGETELDVHVDWQVSRAIRLGGRLEASVRDYEERFVRDSQGAVVPGLATRYEEVAVTGQARFALGPHVGAWLLLQHGERDDGHDGWDDRVRDRALLRWTFTPTDELEIRLTGDFERLWWPRSHVGYAPTGPARRTLDRDVTLEVTLSLGPRWSLQATALHEGHDSRTPGYTHERDEVALALACHLGGTTGRHLSPAAHPRRAPEDEAAPKAPRERGPAAD